MGSKLFVGGLSWGTTDSTLRAAFETFGSLREARVILDRETGKSRGFGFVTFQSEEDAANAIRQMNGAMVDGRTIRVNEAEERRGPGGGGGGGPRGDRPGGYGDRGGGGYGDRGGGGGGGYGDRGGGPGGGYRGGGGPGRDRDRGPRPEVHTRGRTPYSGGGGGGDRAPGGPRGDRPWSPGGAGPGGFRGGPSQPNQQGSDDWGDDRRSRGDRRAKKKAVKQPTGTWDEDAMRMRAPQKREKRESGRTWRDYTADEDFEDTTRPPGEDEEAAEGEEKAEGADAADGAQPPGDESAAPTEGETDAGDALEQGTPEEEE